MAALNDAKMDALAAQLSYRTALPDMTLAWLKANGATSNCVADAWVEMLNAQGVTGVNRNDGWYELLGRMGYTGTITDREFAFWLDGGVINPGSVPIPPAQWGVDFNSSGGWTYPGDGNIPEYLKDHALYDLVEVGRQLTPLPSEWSFTRANPAVESDAQGNPVSLAANQPAFGGSFHDGTNWYGMSSSKGLRIRKVADGQEDDWDQAIGTIDAMPTIGDSLNPAPTNNFCFQVVLVLNEGFSTIPNSGMFFGLNASNGTTINQNENYLTCYRETANPDRMAVAVQKAFNAIFIPDIRLGVAPVAGDVLDVRIRCSSTSGVKVWVKHNDGVFVTKVSASDTTAFSKPLRLIAPGHRYPNPSKQSASLSVDTYVARVRIHAQALSDAEIEAWPTVARPPEPTPIPSFPGAVGHGAKSIGGRYGRVIRVSNLNATGEGSLDAALRATGPRNVIFDVSGVINMGTEALAINQPYCSVWGQTAPSPGITVRGAPIFIVANDCIVRHVKVRPGDTGYNADNRDCYSVEPAARNVILDHISCSWSVDTAIDLYSANTPGALQNVTVSNYIINEALNDADHSAGPHSMALGVYNGAQNITIHRGIHVNSQNRHPMCIAGGQCTFTNIWISNATSTVGSFHDMNGIATQDGKLTMIGCRYTPGVDGTQPQHIASVNNFTHATHKGYMHVNDNLCAAFDGNDPLTAVRDLTTDGSVTFEPEPLEDVSGLGIIAAADMQAQMLPTIGARPAERDEIDARAVANVVSGGGRQIDSQTEVGGWDNRSNNRSLTLPDDHDQDSGNGYTNLEVWVESLHQELIGN